MGQFLSVRTEQPSKVCNEERLKIKVSDDFSQSRLSNFLIKLIKPAYMYLGLTDGVIFKLFYN